MALAMPPRLHSVSAAEEDASNVAETSFFRLGSAHRTQRRDPRLGTFCPKSSRHPVGERTRTSSKCIVYYIPLSHIHYCRTQRVQVEVPPHVTPALVHGGGTDVSIFRHFKNYYVVFYDHKAVTPL